MPDPNDLVMVPSTSSVIEKAYIPHDVAVRQAMNDIAEVAHPTGKAVVFKEIAHRHAPRVKAAIDHVANMHPKDREAQDRFVDAVVADVAHNVTQEIRGAIPDVPIQSSPRGNSPESVVPSPSSTPDQGQGTKDLTLVAPVPGTSAEIAPEAPKSSGGLLVPLAILAALIGGSR